MCDGWDVAALALVPYSSSDVQQLAAFNKLLRDDKKLLVREHDIVFTDRVDGLICGPSHHP